MLCASPESVREWPVTNAAEAVLEPYPLVVPYMIPESENSLVVQFTVAELRPPEAAILEIIGAVISGVEVGVEVASPNLSRIPGGNI